MLTEDGFLISKCLNGDPSAFGILVDKYKTGIYALAYSRLGNFQDAEDITQETFLEAYKRLSTLKRYDRFSSWLYSIANNQCKNFIRSKLSRPDREYIESQDPALIESSASKSYEDKKLASDVREALNSLPETYKKVLLLHYLGGIDCKEIANILGISYPAVRQRLSRGRMLLKDEMMSLMIIAFKSSKLQPDFTFHVLEAVKRLKMNIAPKPTGFSLGLSITTIVIVVFININPFINLIQPTVTSKGQLMPKKVKAFETKEINVPIYILDPTDKTVFSGADLARMKWTKKIPFCFLMILMLP